eukprot:scaffold6.g2813.t1
MAGYSARYRQEAERQQKEREREAPPRRARDGCLSAALGAAPSLFSGLKISAVDRGITCIDPLPERLRGITTLYLSKNALRSLDGVEQFAQLRAVSAADNALPDWDALAPLRSMQLVAASFEGNPLAELPLYRQHTIAMLGPSLQLLDNRPVTEEERTAARSAVAHEQALLALMVTNSCVVHKLGRCVQQLRLHVQLQCAVLGGQFASVAAAERGGIRASGPGVGAVLRMWDYEGGLGPAELRAIQLAIRREVARQHRRQTAGGGGKAEGGSGLRGWQSAYAAVGLQQQETIASLAQLLEEAKEEAACVLAPLTRPASPVKRRALQGGQEADSRLKADRETLIQELRNAFLGLADSGPGQAGAQQHAAAEYEGRIRQLHAALDSAGSQQQQQQQAHAAEAVAAPEAWAIPAVRQPAAEQADSSSQGKPAVKRALKREGHTARPPGRRPPSNSVPASPQASPPQQPGHAAARPSTAARLPGPQTCGAAAGGGQGSPVPERRWQPDDGLAAFEDGEAQEQQRCRTPRPFQSCGVGVGSPQQAAHLSSEHPGSPGRHGTAECQSPGSPGAAPMPLVGWGEAALGKGSAALHDLMQKVARKGANEQVRMLQTAVVQYDSAASQLTAANQELADALQQMQGHALGLEARFQDQQQCAAEQQAAHEAAVAQLAQLSARLEAAGASQEALQDEVAALRQERDAQARELDSLKTKVTGLEAAKPVSLCLAVSYEQEWKAQCLRSAELESTCIRLRTVVDALERQQRLELASERMGGRVLLLRVLRRWQGAVRERAHGRTLQCLADSWAERRLLALWLARWRLAAERERAVRARAIARQRRAVAMAWHAWRCFFQQEILVRALSAASRMARGEELVRQCLSGWRRHAAQRQQVELPPGHPVMQHAAALRQRRLLGAVFGAWREHMERQVAPRLQAARRMAAQLLMGAKLRAWAGWQEHVERRRRVRLLKQVADLHLLSRHFKAWQSNAELEKEERRAALRGILSNNVLLLRRAWRAWAEAQAVLRARRALRSAAEQHARRKVLARGYECWQQWVLLGRRCLQRMVAEWRRAALAGKLAKSLDAVQQLQGAVEHVRGELQKKAAEAADLETVKVKVESRAESLSVRVTCLDADLAALEQKATELEAALEQSRSHLAAAQAAQEAAEAAAATAQQQRQSAEEARAAAVAERKQAAVERDSAVSERKEAEAQATAAREVATTAVAQAEAATAAAGEARAAQSAAAEQAAAAAAERDRLAGRCAALEEEVGRLRAERERLAADLEHALNEWEVVSALNAGLKEEAALMKRQRDDAKVDRARAVAEQQAAAKQAERLAGLGMLASQAQLQGELAALSRRNEQLSLESEAARAQLRELTVLLERTQGEEAAARQLAAQLRAEQSELVAAMEQQGAERERLAGLVAELQDAQVAAGRQLREARAAAEEAQAAADRLAVEKREQEQERGRLQREKDAAARAADALAGANEDLEAQVSQLKDQLENSNGVLESLRGMLADSCARDAADAAATAPLQGMLQNLRAELLLKEGAISMLTRQNEERCERLLDLQQQVGMLRRQVAAGGGGDDRAPVAAPPPRPAHGYSPGEQQQQSAQAGAPLQGAPPAALRHAGQVSTTNRAGSPAGAVSGSPRPCSSYGGAAIGAGQGTSLASALARAAAGAAAGAPAMSDLAPRQSAPGASPRACASPVLAGWPGAAPALSSTAPQAGQPGGFAPRAALASEVSEEDLSCLMELVVQKRISAAQAKAAIDAVARGDPAVLLGVLDQGKRQAEERAGAAPAPSPSRQRGGGGATQRWEQPSPRWASAARQQASAAMSPGTASELAAVRLEIQALAQGRR